MPAAEQSERKLIAQVAAHTSWANTPDRAARTAAARKAALDRFEREVDPEGVLTPAERATRAEHARKAYFARLALKSAKARRLRKGGTTSPEHDPPPRSDGSQLDPLVVGTAEAGNQSGAVPVGGAA